MEDSNKVLYDILLERLELLRALDKEGDSDRRRHVANETADLHAPLAHRLGLYQIKAEMEDLALKFTDYTKFRRGRMYSQILIAYLGSSIGQTQK